MEQPFFILNMWSTDGLKDTNVHHEITADVPVNEVDQLTFQ